MNGGLQIPPTHSLTQELFYLLNQVLSAWNPYRAPAQLGITL